MKDYKDLQRIATDLYKNTPANFSVREGEEILREEISNLICVNGKPNIHKYNKNKGELFQLLEEVFMPVIEPYQLPAELANLIKIETIGYGENREFYLDYPELFDVYKVSDGNIDVRRQTVTSGKVSIPTEFYIVKIYAELTQFLEGKIDWAGLINKVNKSIEDNVARNMAKLFSGVANPIDTATGSFSADTLVGLIEKVEEKYGTGAVIYGKKSVLGKVQDVVQSEKSKEDFNAIGYYGQFRGTPMLQIPTDSDELTILPYNGSPIGVVVREGNPLVLDTGDFGTRNDLQLEYVMRVKLGYASVDVKGATYKLS